ncbi:hypothetical protein, partial [Rhizobium leguminosarum]|uniref:hypothetical protein n=1 Tax=Rhizobium leguminosarum TaxID=384 RepID=UPI003F95D777
QVMSLTSYRAAPPRVIQATLASSVQVFCHLAKYRLPEQIAFAICLVFSCRCILTQKAAL